MKTIAESMIDMTAEIYNLKKQVEELQFNLGLAERENKVLREQNRQLQQLIRGNND